MVNDKVGPGGHRADACEACGRPLAVDVTPAHAAWKMTPARQEAVIAGIRAGLSRTMAADRVGIARRTITRWAARSAAFRTALMQADAQIEADMLALILDAPRLNPQNWTAAAWYLERTRPERYGQRGRLDVSVEMRETARKLGGDEAAGAAILEAAEEILRTQLSQS